MPRPREILAVAALVAVACQRVDDGCLDGDVQVVEWSDGEVLHGARCLDGNLEIKTASDCEGSACQAFASLEAVRGSVTVAEYGGTKFPEFPMLEDIAQDLLIEHNPELASLEPPGRLANIGGDLRLVDNRALVETGTFGALASIGGRLLIYRTGDEGGPPTTTRFDAFPVLEEIGGSLELMLSPQAVQLEIPRLTRIGEGLVVGECLGYGRLTDLDLSSVTEIGGGVQMRCVDLGDLSGLGALTSVGGDLEISGSGMFGGNYGLTSLAGLASLKEVDGTLRLARNDALVDVGQLDVTTVAGLEIVENPALESLLGLEALERIDGDLVIRQNLSLSNTDAQAFAAARSVTGETAVCGNQGDEENLGCGG